MINIYPSLLPDGTVGSRRVKTKCNIARIGRDCGEPQIFEHPLTNTYLPPSPSSTPRSATPNYRSGDESGGSSSSRGKRRSGVYIEINGRPVYTTERRRNRSERIIVVDSPPTSRTPPQAPEFVFPRTAPPSPSPMHAPRRAPIIVDDRNIRRPHVTITTPEHTRHRRTPSGSSHHSRTSSASDDERFRWDQYHARPRRPTDAELQKERLAARIAAANAEINRRAPVPMPPTPPQRSASTYMHPAVEVHTRTPYVMMRDEEKRRQRDEDAAQRQRLKERMTPQRRASVGHGGKRPMVSYPEGIYRLD
jgi:hypothetical protein